MLSVTIISLGILCFISNIRTVYNYDYFWHIRVGEWILQHHKIPTIDLFSWYGKKMHLEFISHEWLSDIIMALLGKKGLSIILPILCTILFLFIYKYLNIKKEKKPWNNIIKIVYAIITILTINHMEMRPGIFSLILFNLVLYIIWNKKNLYWIPIIQLLWVNIHGGSSSLIPLLLILDIGIDLIEKKEKELLKKKIIVFILSVLASFINPYTYKMLLYPYKNMKDTQMLSFITEWQSPNFHGLEGIYNALVLFLPPVLLLYTKKKKETKDILLLALFLFMSLRSLRFILHYIFIGSYIIGKYTDIKFQIKTKRKIVINLQIIKAFTLIATILLSISILNENKKEEKKKTYFSKEIIQEIIKIKPKRMYNDYDYGGYLTYHLYKKNDIFINGICDIYSNNILADYKKLYYSITPEKIINKYDFDLFIIKRKIPLEFYLLERTDYKVIYKDKTGIIFQKK